MQTDPTLNPLHDQLHRPLRDLRVSVTDRCNFRCQYCMPAEVFGDTYKFLPRAKLLTFEEIARVAGIFVGLGVRKVRITGGEPLLRSDVEGLVAQLADNPGIRDLAMTTNGYLLAQKAEALKKAGLRRVSVSLDSLDATLFRKMSGGEFELQRVLEGIQAADEVGLTPIKINMVVQKGVNDEEILSVAEFGREHGYIVRFIEYMDVGNLNQWRMDDVVSAAEILKRISQVHPIEPMDAPHQGRVAERFRYRDGGGEIGVIASVTRPFCGTCTRARLSTDGKVYTCLFAAHGYDIKGPLRAGESDEQIRERLVALWHERSDRYSEERGSQDAQGERKIEMYQIGG
jgi:cyclic pyranopterin phosphate synthase